MLAFPFNFNPNSNEVKTSSYTITAGRHAIVSVEVDPGGTFTIDGNVAMNAGVNDLTAVLVDEIADGSSKYTVPADHYFEGQVYSAGTASVSVGGATVATTTSLNPFIPIKAGPGQEIAVSTGTVIDKTITGFVRRVGGNPTKTAIFYLKPGTQINGSGNWRATVSEFIVPT